MKKKIKKILPSRNEKGELKLFLLVLGGTPKGRNVEQHDVLFCVAQKIEDTYKAVKRFWKIRVHIDSYCIVDKVDGYRVEVHSHAPSRKPKKSLFFINLGGYLKNDLEEYHKKLVLAASDVEKAKAKAKKNIFFKQHLKGVDDCAHVDDSYEIPHTGVDDVICVQASLGKKFSITLIQDASAKYAQNKKVPRYISYDVLSKS